MTCSRTVTTGRLHPREGLENQKIEGHPWLGESGLWFVPVRYEGNQNASLTLCAFGIKKPCGT